MRSRGLEPAPSFVRAARRAAQGELRSRANSAGPVLGPEERWGLEERVTQLTEFLRERGGPASVYLVSNRLVCDYRDTNERVHLAPRQTEDLLLPASELDKWLFGRPAGPLRIPDFADAFRTLRDPDTATAWVPIPPDLRRERGWSRGGRLTQET